MVSVDGDTSTNDTMLSSINTTQIVRSPRNTLDIFIIYNSFTS